MLAKIYFSSHTNFYIVVILLPLLIIIMVIFTELATINSCHNTKHNSLEKLLASEDLGSLYFWKASTHADRKQECSLEHPSIVRVSLYSIQYTQHTVSI